jgi:transposase
MIDHINEELKPIEDEIRSFARRRPAPGRRQAGARPAARRSWAITAGIGELTSVAILAELGDTRRFSSSRHAVRFAGLDVTVHSSELGKRASGKLSRQGSPVLRWAVFEAAQVARRKGSPDHDYLLRGVLRAAGIQPGMPGRRPQADPQGPPRHKGTRRRSPRGSLRAQSGLVGGGGGGEVFVGA